MWVSMRASLPMRQSKRSKRVALAKEMQPDVFISGGGGIAHDTTKAIATLLAEGGDIHDYAIRFEPPDRVMVPPTPAPKLPILSVPTTMGCAEFSRGGGGITDHHLGRKLSLAGEGVSPTVLIDGQAPRDYACEILVSTAIGGRGLPTAENDHRPS